jgi:CHAD domain-containing protein
MYTPHLKEDEKRMIKLFDDLFINRTDIGREYYECSENEIMFQFLLFIKDIYN